MDNTVKVIYCNHSYITWRFTVKTDTKCWSHLAGQTKQLMLAQCTKFGFVRFLKLKKNFFLLSLKGQFQFSILEAKMYMLSLEMFFILYKCSDFILN